jgi:hypothetical protein
MDPERSASLSLDRALKDLELMCVEAEIVRRRVEAALRRPPIWPERRQPPRHWNNAERNQDAPHQQREPRGSHP